jgi:hypothetical protein
MLWAAAIYGMRYRVMKGSKLRQTHLEKWRTFANCAKMTP